jgi:hypothetical protein
MAETIGRALGIVFGFMVTSTLTTYVGVHILTWLEIMP